MDAASIDRARLAELTSRERAQYAVGHPASMRAFNAAGRHLLGGVPMTRMRIWPGGFPLYLATAHGARGEVTDPVPQHGFDVPGDDRRRRRRAHRTVRGRR